MISWGGTVLISLIALSATSLGWIVGFSSFLPRSWASGDGSNVSGTGSGGGGGAKTGSFIGGSSSMSEKLLPAEVAGAGAVIIGSNALDACSSVSGSAIAADMAGPAVARDP